MKLGRKNSHQRTLGLLVSDLGSFEPGEHTKGQAIWLRAVRDEDPTENFEAGDTVTVIGTLRAIPTGSAGKRQILLSPDRIDLRKPNQTAGPHPSVVTADYVHSSLGGGR